MFLLLKMQKRSSCVQRSYERSELEKAGRWNRRAEPDAIKHTSKHSETSNRRIVSKSHTEGDSHDPEDIWRQLEPGHFTARMSRTVRTDAEPAVPRPLVEVRHRQSRAGSSAHKQHLHSACKYARSGQLPGAVQDGRTSHATWRKRRQEQVGHPTHITGV
jgi:hypothetical protein